MRIAVPVVVPIAVLSVFVLRGCDTPGVPLLTPPEGAAADAGPTTSAPQDLSGVELARVKGTTVPDRIRATGTAHLFGSVNGPQGPVPGATVHVEHLVDDNPAIDVPTGSDGRWDLPNIAGGRYRVRAYLPPTLAQTQPEVFFLNDGDQHNLDLAVDNAGGVVLSAAFAPDPPQLNQPFNLVIRVLRKTVDETGVTRSLPVPGALVALTGVQGFAVSGSSTVNADGNGDATFSLECRAAGASQIQATARATTADQPQSQVISVSPCFDPRSTSTTSTPSSSSSSSSSTTTTQPAPN